MPFDTSAEVIISILRLSAGRIHLKPSGAICLVQCCLSLRFDSEKDEKASNPLRWSAQGMPCRSRSKPLSASVWSLAVLAPLVPVQLLLAAQRVAAVPLLLRPSSRQLVWLSLRAPGSVEPLRRRSGVQPPPGNQKSQAVENSIDYRLRVRDAKSQRAWFPGWMNYSLQQR